jgi:quinol monooxygenase YgiN
MNLIVIAQIHSKTEFNLLVQTALLKLVEQTNKEPACKSYDLLQNLTDRNHFTMYEVWESETGFNQHNQMDYIKDFVSHSKNWLTQSMTVTTNIILKP